MSIVCLGSTGGTVKDVVDECAAKARRVGLLELRSFRPLPRHDLRTALDARPDRVGARPRRLARRRAAALRRACGALYGTEVELRSYVYGLGGRDIHPEEIRALYAERAARLHRPGGAPCPV